METPPIVGLVMPYMKLSVAAELAKKVQPPGIQQKLREKQCYFEVSFGLCVGRVTKCRSCLVIESLYC
jgi:hypothetical protein